MSESRSPWRMPLGTLIVLIVIVLAGTVIALASCSASGGSYDAPTEPRTIQQGTADGFTENTITLSDGRTLTCLTWASWDYINDAMKSGMDCLEPKEVKE